MYMSYIYLHYIKCICIYIYYVIFIYFSTYLLHLGPFASGLVAISADSRWGTECRRGRDRHIEVAAPTLGGVRMGKSWDCKTWKKLGWELYNNSSSILGYVSDFLFNICWCTPIWDSENNNPQMVTEIIYYWVLQMSVFFCLNHNFWE